MSSDIEQALSDWRAKVHWYEGLEAARGQDPTDYKSNLAVITLEPRFKFFRPPLIPLFRWAYKTKNATVFTGVYPSAVHTETPKPESVTLGFTVNPYVSPQVDKLANRLKDKLSRTEDDHKC